MNTVMTTPTTTQTLTSNLSNKPGVLSLAIKDKATLYSAYMSFIEGGGLFIPTSKPYKIGDEIFMMLNLPEETEKINVAGRVVWLNSVAQAGKPQGIGVQFNSDNSGIDSKNKIEALLGKAVHSTHPTCTI